MISLSPVVVDEFQHDYGEHREDDCKILFSAEVHGRLYGKLEYGGGWAAERRSFLENLLISTATRSSEQKGCVALNDAVIHIDPHEQPVRVFLDLVVVILLPSSAWCTSETVGNIAPV